MRKPTQISAAVASVEDGSSRLHPCNSAAFLIPLNMPPGDPVGARHVVVEHRPGKPSIILLKIMAMEAHSGNVERLDRRRQFAKRFAPPLKASSTGAR